MYTWRNPFSAIAGIAPVWICVSGLGKVLFRQEILLVDLFGI